MELRQLLFITYFFLSSANAVPATRRTAEPDIGPDTCGQDRITLGNWFISHGSPDLLEEPIPELVHYVSENPYDNPSNPPQNPDTIQGFCAVQWTENTDPVSGLRKYRLANFPSEQEAINAGFNITHKGQCAACSGLQDLGTYIKQNLTESTRLCGALGAIVPGYLRPCLNKLGFSDMCASIWEYNIKNTRDACFSQCIWAWITNAPFNKPDGSLNNCLQCDEDVSGPNFKYFSGRTRRNSGIPSAIYRPPETIYNMTHCYWYGELV